MKPPDHILLARLLREREAALVSVWECEEGIRKLLHSNSFIFPDPPSLPSCRRTPRPASLPAATAATAVRRLRPGEDAYRLTCLHQGTACESLSDAPEAVRALAEAAAAELSVLRIETMSLDASGAAAPLDCLWGSDQEAPGAAPPAHL